MAIIAGTTLSQTLPASATASVVDSLQMQLDGNTAVNAGAAQPYDWQSFFSGPGDVHSSGTALPSGFIARGVPAVDYALPDVSTFSTGSKDTLPITPVGNSGWQCGKSNNLLAKDDLQNVYTVAYRDPSNHHLILYFGAEKSSNAGDNNIGIWFLQDPNVSCTVPASGKNTDFGGQHLPGDVLLTAAFTNGGTTATVQAFTWMAGSANGGVGSLSSAQTGFLCGTGGTDKLCAITNDSANQGNADGSISVPWNTFPKVAGTSAGNSLASEEFYEGGVDVTQLELDTGNTNANPCVATYVADTRSSQQPTATLFDYALGAIPVCSPNTTLTASPPTSSPGKVINANLAPNSTVLTFTEANTGNVDLTSPSVTTDNTGCSPAYTSGDTNTDGILGVGETWTFTCTLSNITANTVVTAIGHGTDPLNRDVTYCTMSDSTHVCKATERAQAEVDVVNPATSLTASPTTSSPATIHSGDSQVFTFTEANTGDVELTSPSVTTDNAGCSPAYVSGDTNGDGILSVGETWTYTCTLTGITSTTTITGTGHGTVYAHDVTACLSSNSTHVCMASEQAQGEAKVINPSTSLLETASAAITYTFKESNNGDGPLTSPSITWNPSQCDAAPAYQSGDTNHDGVLSVGETWVFTCTHTLAGPATDTGSASETNVGIGNGTDAASTPLDVTFCAAGQPTTGKFCDSTEKDSVTVTITNNAQGT